MLGSRNRTYVRLSALACAAGLALASSTAEATPTLIAIGTLNATTDLSGLSGILENGIDSANILGGIGSGLAYAGGNTFLAVPDRGPNATTYDGNVDSTVSYISRFQTLDMSLTPNGGPGLPFVLTPTLTATTLLLSATPLAYGTGVGLGPDAAHPDLPSGAPSQNTANTFYFTGRSDNFDASQNSGNASNARFDPESIRVSPDRKSVFVSDEYGPYVYQFDRTTGQRIKSFALPSNLDVTNLSPVGATEISGNTSGRTANKGMEGLAITPDGKTLVGMMQAALIQDNTNPSKKLLRFVTIDVATGTTHQYGYLLTTGSGVSDIVAINDHQFLVDERDGAGLGDGTSAVVKQIFKIDITGATDITNMTGAQVIAANATVGKSSFLNVVNALVANGITTNEIPAKLEGLAFGQDVLLNGALEHTLYLANDNDFVPDTAGPNVFYVFGFTDTDLPGFQAQAFVPEPVTLALFASGLGGLFVVSRRRRRSN